MHSEDRLYLQMIIGTSIGIVLGIVAFAMVTSCTIGSLCSTVDAAETLPQVNRQTRQTTLENRLVPQVAPSDLDAIIVQWNPVVEGAISDQQQGLAIIDDEGLLPTGHQLSSVPGSRIMSVETDLLDHLIDQNATKADMQHLNWDARDWMIVTGGYNLLAAAELDAELFKNAGYDIQIFFRGDEFRTAIVGYNSADAAAIDLVNIREKLRTSAQLGQFDSWCTESVEREEFVECKNE